MKTYADLPRQDRIDKIMELRRSDLCLVLENLSEDKNISAILRTAEAFGVGQIHIIYTPGSKPKLSMGTSSGATKWLKVEYHNSITECLKDLKEKGYLTVGALVDPKAHVLWDQNFIGKVAIVMGTETTGLTEEAQRLVDQNIYLPMYGLTESLNVSVATAIFLYEVIRQKEAKTE